jgi:hypothetical protein
MTGNHKPNDFAENLALNRTIGSLGKSVPNGTRKKYLDFWIMNNDLYTNMEGDEKVAVLRSYPSMAYNTLETQVAVNMAEQALQQRQIPFDIIFDEQIDELSDYKVLILANQESLTDGNIETIKSFVFNGGGLVVTGNTGKFDGWRRLRKQSMLEEMLSKENKNLPTDKTENTYSFEYGKGQVIYIPELISPDSEVKLGFESIWHMPLNANELESAVYWAAGERLPLEVKAPEWVGVSHDKQKNRDIIHLFNYNTTRNVSGITLEIKKVIHKAWSVSPDENNKQIIHFNEENGITTIRIPNLKTYRIIVLEKINDAKKTATH